MSDTITRYYELIEAGKLEETSSSTGRYSSQTQVMDKIVKLARKFNTLPPPVIYEIAKQEVNQEIN